MSHPFDKGRTILNRSPLDDRRLLSGAYWAELRTFLAVAKSKSFNRAAQSLGISQPKVSRQVHRLQDQIGSQLLLPSATGVVLTDKGRQLAEMLLALDEQLSVVSHNLGAEKQEAEGYVRFSSTEALAGLFVVPRLAEFSERFPRINLHLRNTINMNSFQENQSDIVLAFSPSERPEISSSHIGYVHLLPFASDRYLSQVGVPTRSNLEDHRFVDAEYYMSQNELWSPWRTAVRRGSVAHLCDNSFAYCLMVKEGLGIGLLGNYIAADRDLIPLDIDVCVRLELFLQASTERLRARPVRVAYDWLRETFGQNPWFQENLTLGSSNPRQSLSAAARRIFPVAR